MSAKSPKKWNCLEEIRTEIKEKEKVEKAIRIVCFLQRGKSEKVVSAEWEMGPSVFPHDSRGRLLLLTSPYRVWILSSNKNFHLPRQKK